MFDWFWDAIKGYCNGCLEAISNSIGGIATNDSLFKPLNEAIGGVYDLTILIQQNITGPIGITILSLLVMIEVVGNLTRNNDFIAGENIGPVIYNVGLKFVAIKLVIDAAPSFMTVIYDIVRAISKGIADLAIDKTPAMEIGGRIGDMPDNGGLLLLAVVRTVTMLIAIVAGMAATVLIGWRMINIYLLYAFSPISLSWLACDGTRQAGITFIRRFAATCLQAAILVTIVAFFPFVLDSFSVDFSSSDPTVVTQAAATTMGYCIVLLVALFSTNKAASTIVGD